jgi:pimeloyl-ACP methyl ester carboxylesterase
MVGHSNGGDISMFFAKLYPDQINKVVTLDNLRVPFMTEDPLVPLKGPRLQNRPRRHS